MKIRKAAVSGAFYPDSPEIIENLITHYNKILDENFRDILNTKPRAIIVPHAGYLYSGFTANFAFRLLANTQAKRIVVIGPSHKVYLKGTSVSNYDYYETPFGKLSIDQSLVNELEDRFALSFTPEAHQEHSTEVQMPFIKWYNPNAKVVELVYGDEDSIRLSHIIDYLLDDPKTVVVISTDLSHYYDIEKAKILDRFCILAVDNISPSELHHGCEACGKIGVEAMLLAAQKRNLRSIVLDYRTSADANGDISHVVGYMSAAFVEE